MKIPIDITAIDKITIQNLEWTLKQLQKENKEEDESLIKSFNDVLKYYKDYGYRTI